MYIIILPDLGGKETLHVCDIYVEIVGWDKLPIT